MSPEPFYRISIPFTDHSYRFQVIRTFYGQSIAFTDHSYRLQFTCTFLRTIHCFNTSFLSSPSHLYLFTDHPLLLQIIPIVSRSPVPFYGSSVALTDTFYHLQVTWTFLRSIHSFYKSFLSFPGHPYLFTDHP